ncbi:NAD(P)H-binding family protein [Rhizoctonia solani AG-3 Rhs1AP]|uniref:NAD(P)H-binding family protein n=1 Tax=Rhizoctonia solani AG-3 Rhs1AP TaxID=1086054 RepID=X8JE85_9AGAM|nr:NAD(P)H-binding family protein [Rhizoctonia solani AG-3 Rhs1AP]
MSSRAIQHVFVVGGNGFLGSTVCKAAVARGWRVTSISSSGRPYRTPKGHTPAWTREVDFRQASAFEPSTYRELLESCTAVVHTIGTLLEAPKYKSAVRGGSLGGLVSAFGQAWGLGAAGNPLEKRVPGEEGTYEYINRDAALRVLETFASGPGSTVPRPFVYISAEDIFRPLVPARYIESKRAAEAAIAQEPRVRGIYLRPGLMYHPHTRPLTTPIATLLDLSASMHQKMPLPGPANLLRALASTNLARSQSSVGLDSTAAVLDSPLEAMARALETPPIHVEHVAQAACEAIAQEDVVGPYGVGEMRRLIGWGTAPEARQSEAHTV